MSILYYHPLGEKATEIQHNSTNYSTYAGHGAGAVDIVAGKGTPIYAMCNGVVTVGAYTDIKEGDDWDTQNGYDYVGTTYCILKCSETENGLGMSDFRIRYLHGDYLVKTGDIVKKGQQIGTVHSHGQSTGYHLHIDFVTKENNNSNPIVGVLSNNNTTFIRDGKTYKINKEKIDWDLIESFKSKAPSNANPMGYCWLVMAYKDLIIKKGNGIISMSGEELWSKLQELGWNINYNSYGANACTALINTYNALMETGKCNAGAAIAMTANAFYENLGPATSIMGNNMSGAIPASQYYTKPERAAWGRGNGPEGDRDCGIWALHQPNGDAYLDIVVPYYMEPLKKLGYTQQEIENCSYQIHADLTMLTVNHEIKVNRFLARWGDGVRVTVPITNHSVCATLALQKQYENDFNQYFIDSNNDLETGALLFERLYENSGQYQPSLQGRALLAYCLGKAFGIT